MHVLTRLDVPPLTSIIVIFTISQGVLLASLNIPPHHSSTKTQAGTADTSFDSIAKLNSQALKQFLCSVLSARTIDTFDE